MKIIVLYGPGEVQKREQALKIRRQFSLEGTVIVDYKQDSQQGLEAKLSSPSLFQVGPQLIIVENPPDNLDLEKLIRAGQMTTLLVMGGSPRVDSVLLQSAKKTGAQVSLFNAEKELSAFLFLDNLIEGKKESFIELEKLLKGYGGMYVLTMIYYLLRRNLLPLPPSSFLHNKIKKQQQRFSKEDWIRLYATVIRTEFEIKSGILNERMGLLRLTQQFILV
ncbi:MAG: hypothetical protein C4584_00695 [Armatimonadetes bacterium]|nr:MAG: hypothetical protein C4584_00695 [Armatimonadota bacterium]